MDIHIKILLTSCLFVFVFLGTAGALLDAAIWYRNKLAQSIVNVCTCGVAVCFAVMFVVAVCWLWSL